MSLSSIISTWSKTYLAASIIKNWMKLNPGKDVYVISKLDDDKVIDDLGPRIKRINIETFKEVQQQRKPCIYQHPILIY